jgi:imidazolonepropionase-like amidohydrolase
MPTEHADDTARRPSRRPPGPVAALTLLTAAATLAAASTLSAAATLLHDRSALEAEPAPDTLVVRGVTVVDPDGARLLPDRDVVVVDSGIVAVVPTGQAPAGHRTLEGRGGFLVPGLWDSHVHVESVPGEARLALPVTLAAGVTTVRDLGTLLTLEELRNAPAGELLGPRIVPHGAMIDGPPGAWPGQRIAASPREGRARVREAAGEGWPAVKTYSLLSRDTYRAIADEAGALGLAVVGHVPESVTLAEAVDAGHRSIAHVGRVTQACSSAEEEMVAANRAALASPDPLPALMEVMAGHNATTLAHWDETRCREVARLLARAGVAVTPTLMVADFYLGKDPPPDDPRMASIPAPIRARWTEADFRREQMTEEMLAMAPEVVAMDWRTVRMLHEEGVPVLAGTDAAYANPYLFHGYTLHDELARLVEAGLSPAEALAAATTVPARLFAPERPEGIRPGARADLLLLEENPLASVGATRTIRAVVAAGRVLDSDALDALRRSVEREAAAVGSADASPPSASPPRSRRTQMPPPG